tara:strand:- start:1517 stop:1813 length:297 start_codon:yes stop_codon:yes gene_type:complete
MEVYFYILCGVLLVGCGILSFALYRSITLNQNYEQIHENIHGELNNLSNAIEDLMAREIYSDDPTIMRFVDVLTELQPFLKSMNPDLSFNILGEEIKE